VNSLAIPWPLAAIRRFTLPEPISMRKPRMLVAIELANKMARSIWAMLTKAEAYRVPVAAAA